MLRPVQDRLVVEPARGQAEHAPCFVHVLLPRWVELRLTMPTAINRTLDRMDRLEMPVLLRDAVV